MQRRNFMTSLIGIGLTGSVLKTFGRKEEPVILNSNSIIIPKGTPVRSSNGMMYTTMSDVTAENPKTVCQPFQHHNPLLSVSFAVNKKGGKNAKT